MGKPTNAYNLLLSLSGMSLAEAAAFHDVRVDTTTSWSAGRRRFPAGALAEIQALVLLQESEAARLLSNVRRAKSAAKAVDPKFVSDDARSHYLMPVPDTDADAKKLGFPCVGAWRAMAGRLVVAEPGVAFGGMEVRSE